MDRMGTKREWDVLDALARLRGGGAGVSVLWEGDMEPTIVGRIERRGTAAVLFSAGVKFMLDRADIGRVIVAEGEVVIEGGFKGAPLRAKRFDAHMTEGHRAACAVGGEAGWLDDAIKSLQWASPDDQYVVVSKPGWGGRLRRLLWVEYDNFSGEMTLIAGDADKPARVDLHDRTLGDAVVLDTEILVSAVDGSEVRLLHGVEGWEDAISHADDSDFEPQVRHRSVEVARQRRW
jgi:hypothetical protein